MVWFRVLSGAVKTVRNVSSGAWRGRMPHLLMLCLFAGMVRADDAMQVTIKQQRSVNGVITSLADDAYASTDAEFVSVVAEERVGSARFIYWEISPEQPGFAARDQWGRAYDYVCVVPKDSVVILTAVYMTEGDEAEKTYWYGDVSVSMDSDTDGDGYAFSEELQYGMNSHFPNLLKVGGIGYGDSDLLVYNPNGYAPYTIKSDPEEELFETTTLYVSPGTEVVSPSFSPDSSNFAYWTVDGVRQQDAFGAALNVATFIMPDRAVEVVAHCASDEAVRMAQYWYGDASVSPDSDTDGDGYTFAEELQYGMNPHFANVLKLGGIGYGDSGVLWYNPNSYSPYSVSAVPSNRFETVSGFLKPGEVLETENYGGDADFAYWVLNGVRQADVFGRALDSLSLVGTGTMGGGHNAVAYFSDDVMSEEERAIAYWYGPDSDVTPDSDTDGDGYTFAEELVYGMNPHFANELKLGGIGYGDSDLMEANLQPFDLGNKALIGNATVDFFSTIDDATGTFTGGIEFNGAVAVVILDVNSDGLFDLLIYADKKLTLYKNVGNHGSPDFGVVDNPYPLLSAALATLMRPVLCGADGQIAFSDNGGVVRIYDIASNTIIDTVLVGYPLWDAVTGEWIVLGDLSLNVATEDITSAAFADVNGDKAQDLLIASNDGRISLYTNGGTQYILQHRLWGGSYIGFAEGLTMAPVDWDGDGDMDMVCGTADGRILLLHDPSVGAPSNLRAEAGFDNVALEWDPNGQSRVYGYKAYRAAMGDGGADAVYAEAAEVQLPAWRDVDAVLSGAASWSYYVTALSRLWSAGNSEPELFESLPSQAVSASLGGVVLSMPEEMVSYDDADIDVQIFINNSMGVSAEGLAFELSFDPKKLKGIKAATTALSEEFFIESRVDQVNGVWSLSSLEGEMAPGSGVLFTLRFAVEPESFGETVISLTRASLFSASGVALRVNAMPLSTVLSVVEREVSPEDGESDEEAEAPPADDNGGEDGESGESGVPPADGGEEATKPVKVIPWKNGNCNNDHVLDWDDYEAGKRVIVKYDGVLAATGNGIDHQIYRSIQQALGLNKKDVLIMEKHLPLFYQYISEHCGEGKKKK